jgi:plastocyanin
MDAFRRRTRLRFVALLACVAALAAACGSDVPEVPVVDPAAFVLEARNVEFSPATLVLPTGTPVRILFLNRDEGVPHGLTFSLGTSGVPPEELGQLEITTGPDEREFGLAPLPVGVYLFTCPVHPSMLTEVDAR